MSSNKLQRYLNYLAQDPTNPKLIFDVAKIYHATGDLLKAIELIEHYCQQHGETAEALGLLAVFYLDNKMEEKAKKAAHSALELDAHDLNAQLTLTTLSLKEENAADSLTQFKQFTQQMPDNGRAWFGLGIAEMLNLNIDQALAAFTKVSALLPNFIGNWQAIAWCQLLLNHIPAAKASFEHALMLNRNFSENHGGLAMLAMTEGNETLARRETEIALKLDPRCFSGRYVQALLIGKTDPKSAQEKINALLKELPLHSSDTFSHLITRIIAKKHQHGQTLQ